MNASPILRALFDRLRERCPSFGPGSMTRRLVSPSSGPPLPHLEMRTLQFEPQSRAAPGMPIRWLIRVVLIIRAQAGIQGFSDSGEDPVFDLVAEVVAALAPIRGELGALDGHVQGLELLGTIDVNSANIGTEVLEAFIPLEIIYVDM